MGDENQDQSFLYLCIIWDRDGEREFAKSSEAVLWRRERDGRRKNRVTETRIRLNFQLHVENVNK